MPNWAGMKKTDLVREVVKVRGWISGWNEGMLLDLQSMKDALTANDPSLLKKATGEAPKSGMGFLNEEVLRGFVAGVVHDELGEFTPKGVDEDAVSRLIAEALKGFKSPMTEISVLRGGSAEPINVGVQHRQFTDLLHIVEAEVIPFMVGPAGSFKTSAAAGVAKALGLPFYAESLNEGMSPFDLLGYRDAKGDTVQTKLRLAWEKGGVMLFDEMDAGNANTLAALNLLLSQEVASFPDGMIPKHRDFIPMAAGNTKGGGADMKFVGRNQLDGATLDRFAFLIWEYDEDFELHVAGGDMADWTKYVQKVRRAAAQCGVLGETVFATPRASINGAKMLRKGKLNRETIENLTLWSKLSVDDASKVRNILRSLR